MAGFLYYAKGHRGSPDLETAKKWGLDYAFESPLEVGIVLSHPAGGRGVIFGEASRHDGTPVKADYDNQTWRKMPTKPGRPELWLGYYTESPPTPEDLGREQMLPGGRVRLADDNWWMVPSVRRHDGEQWHCELPVFLDYNDAGELVPGKPIARHRHLWEKTAALGDMLISDDEDFKGKLTDEQVWNVAVDLLKANYVVDVPELVCLGALSNNEPMTFVCIAACRIESLMDWLGDLKKSENPEAESGLTTSDTNGDLPQTTPPPSPTVVL